jgi:hypothetical protein
MASRIVTASVKHVRVDDWPAGGKEGNGAVCGLRQTRAFWTMVGDGGLETRHINYQLQFGSRCLVPGNFVELQLMRNGARNAEELVPEILAS